MKGMAWVNLAVVFACLYCTVVVVVVVVVFFFCFRKPISKRVSKSSLCARHNLKFYNKIKQTSTIYYIPSSSVILFLKCQHAYS